MNPYEILGVTPEATTETIKAAYREKAKRHHPDVGGDPEAFDAIQKAYEILADHDRRARYDATGDATAPSLNDDLDMTARGSLGQAIIGLFDERGDRIHSIDVISLLKLKIAENRSGVEKQLAEMVKRKVRAEKVIARATTKNGESNVFAGAFASVIAHCESHIGQMEKALKVMERMVEIIDHHEFQWDKPLPRPKPNPNGLGGVFFTNTAGW